MLLRRAAPPPLCRRTRLTRNTRLVEAQAKKTVEAEDPILLGLALNYSVFLYEIAGHPEEACTLARSAFDDACKNLGNLEVCHACSCVASAWGPTNHCVAGRAQKGSTAYQDSTVIMQLIRDNLTLWSSETGNVAAPEEDGTAVEDM